MPEAVVFHKSGAGGLLRRRRGPGIIDNDHATAQHGQVGLAGTDGGSGWPSGFRRHHLVWLFDVGIEAAHERAALGGGPGRRQFAAISARWWRDDPAIALGGLGEARDLSVRQLFAGAQCSVATPL